MTDKKKLIYNGNDPLSLKCNVVASFVEDAITFVMDKEFPDWRDKPAEPWLGSKALQDPEALYLLRHCTWCGASM